MKKLSFFLFIAMILGLANSCEITIDVPEGQAMFWSDFNGNIIDVYVDGDWAGEITAVEDYAPSCGATGSATIDLAPGTYSNWYAEERNTGVTWNEYGEIGALSISSDLCTKILLEEQVGDIMFWMATGDYNVEVYIDNSELTLNNYSYGDKIGTISNNATNGTPDCWDYGFASEEVAPGTYYFFAKESVSSGSYSYWTGTITAEAGICKTMKLTYGKSGNGLESIEGTPTHDGTPVKSVPKK